MMKRLLLCLISLMLALPAHAETADYTGRIREDMPLLTVTVTQEGEFDHDARHPYTLAAHITSADGTLAQEIAWQSNETPHRERAAALVRFVLFLISSASVRSILFLSFIEPIFA